MTEVWVDIFEWEGYYQVSNYGRVKSLKRENVYTRNGKDVVFMCSEKILKGHLDSDGYVIVKFRDKERVEYKKVHRLVGFAFKKKKPHENFINHKNAVRSDNHIDNIEWTTPQGNSDHCKKLGRVPKGESHPLFGMKGSKSYIYGSKNKISKVVIDLQTGIFYDCAREAAESRGVNYSTLKCQLNGTRKNNTSLVYA